MKKFLVIGICFFLSGISAQTLILKPLTAIAAFKKAGLKAEKPRLMEPKEFGIAPVVTEDAYIFGIPQVCSDCNGRIFSVPNDSDRVKLVKTYVDLGKNSSFMFSWVFEYKNLVLQLNGDMKRAEANKYKTVLQTLK
jgi:hypothetical protein